MFLIRGTSVRLIWRSFYNLGGITPNKDKTIEGLQKEINEGKEPYEEVEDNKDSQDTTIVKGHASDFWTLYQDFFLGYHAASRSPRKRTPAGAGVLKGVNDCDEPNQTLPRRFVRWQCRFTERTRSTHTRRPHTSHERERRQCSFFSLSLLISRILEPSWE